MVLINFKKFSEEILDDTPFRSSQPEVFCEKKFLKISQIYRKTPVPKSLFLIKLQASASNFFEKETLAQMLSDGFCEIFKNTFFHRKSPVDASNLSTAASLLYY